MLSVYKRPFCQSIHLLLEHYASAPASTFWQNSNEVSFLRTVGIPQLLIVGHFGNFAAKPFCLKYISQDWLNRKRGNYGGAEEA